MAGTIFSGTYANGVILTDPAAQNPATVAATGYVYDTVSAGVALLGEVGFAWTVTNLGTINGKAAGGVGVKLDSGGSVINFGTIEAGGIAVSLSAGGSVTNGAGGVARGEAVVFADAGGTVQLDRPRLFAARFFGFGPGDTIDLPGKAPDGFSFSNHQLILTSSAGIVADLHFAGPHTASDFALSPDGNGGTDITLVASVGRADFWAMRG